MFIVFSFGQRLGNLPLINVTKCYHPGITCKRIPINFNYTLDGKLISRVASATYLGISISDNLSWNKHCDFICKKANSTLDLLRRILSGCTPEVKSTAYLTLVRPKLEYASCVWNPHTQCNINKIEMVQRRAARFVHNDYSRFTHVSPLIKALGWDSLEYRRLTNQVFTFYKIYTGLVGISLPPEVVCNTRASRLPNCARLRVVGLCSWNPRRAELFILCKLGKETGREWGEAGNKPTTEVSLLFKFPFLRNGKYWLDDYLSICRQIYQIRLCVKALAAKRKWWITKKYYRGFARES